MGKITVQNKEFALYKGERCLAIGTIKEIAKETNKRVNTIYFYTTPTYQKRTEGHPNRLTMVELED